MRRVENEIDLDNLRRYMAVPAKKKMRFLAEWQAFRARIATPEGQAVRDVLKKKGF